LEVFVQALIKPVREAIDKMLKDDQQSKLKAAEAHFQVEPPMFDWQFKIKRD